MKSEALNFLVSSFCGTGLRFVIKTLPTTFRTRNYSQKQRVKDDIKEKISKKYTKESCRRFFEGEIKVELTCFFNKRYSGTDVDNIVKFTLDAMKGLAFTDNRQIKELIIKKLKAKKISNEYISVGISKQI